MKSVLISIRPKWVEKIANGEKTIEVRKTAPKETPFKAYIYCTIGNGMKGDYLVPSGIQCGKVIGEFICDKIYELFPFAMGTGIELLDELVSPEMFCKKSCLTEQEICDYIGEKDGYGWHISDLKIYDKPKELSEYWGRINCLYAHTRGCWSCFATCLEINGKHCQPLTRAPQSWQFVEEIKK